MTEENLLMERILFESTIFVKNDDETRKKIIDTIRNEYIYLFKVEPEIRCDETNNTQKNIDKNEIIVHLFDDVYYFYRQPGMIEKIKGKKYAN